MFIKFDSLLVNLRFGNRTCEYQLAKFDMKGLIVLTSNKINISIRNESL